MGVCCQSKQLGGGGRHTIVKIQGNKEGTREKEKGGCKVKGKHGGPRLGGKIS